MAKALSLGDQFKQMAKIAKTTEDIEAVAKVLKQWAGPDIGKFEASGKVSTLAGMFGASGKGPDGLDLSDAEELTKRIGKKNPGAAAAIKHAYGL